MDKKISSIGNKKARIHLKLSIYLSNNNLTYYKSQFIYQTIPTFFL